MKKIYMSFYVACFLLLFPAAGNSQVFNQNVNNDNPAIESPHIIPPVVHANPEEPLSKNSLNSPLRSTFFDDDDPNGGGTGLGELPVSDGTMAIVLLGAAYVALTTYRVRFKRHKKTSRQALQ